MRSRDATADAVSRLLPSLGPLAVLLTDDPDDAVRLLTVALAAPKALDDPDHAVPALLRAAEHPSRWTAVQVIDSPSGALSDGGDAPLAAAWADLPLPDRAAVVAHELAGLPSADAPRARLRGDLARRDADARREARRTAALYRRPGAVPDADPPQLDLARRLERLTRARPLPETAADGIARSLEAAGRARSKRRLGLAAGVLAIGALLVVPSLLPEPPAPPEPVSVYAGPVRGSLAGDEAFLQVLRRSGWEAAASGPRRVVFAGDVAGGRWALLSAGGSPSRPATTAWFAGPPGAAPDRLSLVSARVGPDPSEPVALTDPATGALVVVSAPGDRVRVSARPYVDVGGSVSRTFWGVPASHGGAVVTLLPVPGADTSAARVEVTRQGRRLDVRPPAVVADPATAAVGEPVGAAIGRVRPPPPPDAGDGAVAPRLRALLAQLGEPVESTAVTAVWAGDLPGPNDRPARLTVLAVPQPSGAVVVTTPFGYAADTSGRSGSSWCGTGILPAGLPVDQRVIAVRCDLSDLAQDAEISRFLVVVGPRTATSARLLDPQGAVLRELPLTDGVAVVRSPGDVGQVSVTTSDGGMASAVPLTDADLTG